MYQWLQRVSLGFSVPHHEPEGLQVLLFEGLPQRFPIGGLLQAVETLKALSKPPRKIRLATNL
jgi:hypothetical protein